MNSYSLHPKAILTYQTKGKHHFFGYYDKCPWSKDGRFLLSLETDFIDRLPTEKNIARIKVFNLESGESKIVAETYAWNFQQGCMLQWLGQDFQERVIFNDFRRGQLVSVIFNVLADREEKEIPFPVYAVHPSGKFALSLDFSLLDEVREGYGYKNGEIDARDHLIYSFDLDEPHDKKYTIYDGVLHNESLDFTNPNGKHWADHLTISPSGDYFAFLHRQPLKSGGFSSQLYLVRTDGKIIIGRPDVLLDSGMASHFVWKNDEELLVWGRPPSVTASVIKNVFLRRILVSLYHALFPTGWIRQKVSGDSFLLFKNLSKSFEKIGSGKLIEDGHCSFSPDKKWLLTDTYASKDNMRKLLLFNLESEKLIEVGSFYALPDPRFNTKPDFASSNLRADLHPRWNRDGTQICIDSVHSGSRQMHIIDVRDIVES